MGRTIKLEIAEGRTVSFSRADDGIGKGLIVAPDEQPDISIPANEHLQQAEVFRSMFFEVMDILEKAANNSNVHMLHNVFRDISVQVRLEGFDVVPRLEVPLHQKRVIPVDRTRDDLKDSCKLMW
ncbi:hypothetical protein HDU96_002532, partial [Phlyctochytrium bullatum]